MGGPDLGVSRCETPPHDVARAEESQAAKSPLLSASSAALSDDTTPDVETTNWNAVRALASKYGIQLPPRINDQQTSTADLGVGTPFQITARPIEGGRMMYKFHPRNSTAAPADQAFSPASPLANNNNNNIATQESDLGSSQDSTASRKQAFKTLRASRSIPGLRSRAASGLLWGMAPPAPSAAPIAPQQRSVSAKTPSKAKDPIRAHQMPASETSPSSSRLAPLASFVRATSRSKAVEPANLQGGDVLGAILDLPANIAADTPADTSTSSAASYAELFPSSTGRSHTLRPAAFGSAVAVGRREDSKASFTAGRSTNERGETIDVEKTSLLGNTTWDHSPIPQIPNVGSPLFDDLDAFAKGAGDGRSPRTPRPASESREDIAADPDRSDAASQHLRPMQSFDTTASSSHTTRPDDETGTAQLQSLEPAARLPSSFGDLSATYIFDVFQSYDESTPKATIDSTKRPPSQTGTFQEKGHLGLGMSQADSFDRGLNALSADDSLGQASCSSAQDTSADAAPADDPRFVLWAMPDSSDSGKLILSNRNGADSIESDAERLAGTRPPSAVSSASSTRDRSASQSGPRRVGRVAEGGSLSPPLNHKSRQRMPSGTSVNSRISDSHTDGSAKRPLSRQSAQARHPKASAIAATPARLVAEITAEIHSRLMTDFFYTFRAFMSTQELLDLLIARFHWALSDPVSPEDDARRRIVRVRTYVVIKYWITNFFEVDFLGDKAVRNSLTDWLNTLGNDPRLPDRPAEMSIVASLKKIVRNLKHAYAKTGVGALVRHEPGQVSSAAAQVSAKRSSQSSTSLDDAQEGQTVQSSADSQFEHRSLSFAKSGGRQRSSSEASTSLLARVHDIGPHAPRKTQGPGLSVGVSSGAMLSPPSPMTQNNALSRALANTVGRFSRLKKTIGHHLASQAGEGGSELYDYDSMDHGDLLYMRGGVANLIQQFHLDQDGDGDSGETPNDGPNAGLSDGHGTTEETPSLSTSSAMSRSTPASSIDLTDHRRNDYEHPEPDFNETGTGSGLGIQIDDKDASAAGAPTPLHFAKKTDGPASPSADLDSSTELEVLRMQPAFLQVNAGEDSVQRASYESDRELSQARLRNRHFSRPGAVHHVDSDQTLRSFIAPSTFASQTSGRTSMQDENHRPSPRLLERRRSADSCRPGPADNVVQIDEVDLSSDEDDGAVRRALRRLPGVRDLRTANNVPHLRPQRQSLDSLASFGRVYPDRARTSLAPSLLSRQPSTSRAGEAATSMDLFDPDEALAGYELVKGFRVEDFGSDDEEPGDVEEALRRLEGFIDDDKKAQRAQRVENLWEQSRARQGNQAEREDSLEAPSDVEVVDDEGEAAHEAIAGGQGAPVEEAASGEGTRASTSGDESVAQTHHRRGVTESRGSGPALEGSDKKDTSLTRLAPPSTPVGPAWTRTKNQKRPQTAMPGLRDPQRDFVPPHILNGPAPVHRCFLLSYKSEVIAQQFTLIEAELFKAVDWTELVSDRWRERRHKSEVLDWESFYQARVRARAAAASEGKAYRETAVEAIIARFNLTCNWVASEVVLTRNLDERVAVISKLIRVAFRCYQYLNFATVVEICLGLQTPWVERLSKTWSRVNSRDKRILRDLKALTSPLRNFRHLRTAMRGMVEEGSLEDIITVSGPSHARQSTSIPTTGTTGGTTGAGTTKLQDCCVPFFGLFITDLALNECLPSLLDPSCPNSAAQVDSNRHLMKLKDPKAFANLPPLPPHVKLEPLVNLFKFRNIAGTVKTVLAFQAMARNYSFRADAAVYVKCLKIRCLEGRHMTDLSNRLEA